MMSEIRLRGGKIRVDEAGKLVENSLDERAREFATLLDADVSRNVSGSKVPYDACSTATLAYYAALAAEITTCGTVPFTLVGAAACAAAAAAAIAAAQAKNEACAPQNCYADWQCTDKYGPGYVCSGGGCVYSSIDWGGGGGGDPWGGGGYGGGSCYNDWQCPIGYWCLGGTCS
jgi:hypothetical protein